MARARTTALLAAILLVGLLGAPAAAHVTVAPDEADAQSTLIGFRVGHGCAGSPTTAVRVQVPDGVEGVTPQVVPGWDLEVQREGSDAGGHGTVTEVAWAGGPLPDEHMQEFGLSVRFTDEAPDVVYFPVVQQCAEGEHRWIDIPASLEEWDDLAEPAPYVRLAFREAAGDGASSTDPLAAAGLVAGLLGLAAGGLALARTRRA